MLLPVTCTATYMYAMFGLVFSSKATSMSREQIVAEQAAATQGLEQAQLALARSQNAINDPITLAAVQAAYVAMQVCLCEDL